ncbi:chorismate mutase [Salmonella bongori]|uniref:chorismate mutase n=1 Tax=Salmonella bongori TaxID=54736 RepID=UPI00126DC140|nr:chorismate mutase [Salmonella bongori]EGE4654927.1 chorismate mutase [Salmonella bongori serovar 40:z35:- str. 95-0123]ECC8922916.1 chorismate mutase [Salmonella bongori]ECC9595961.1 chorismate mutase [Salmonella bongori]EDP8662309.1 chorismate mutase [Salmonella bongori]QVP35854.1 chorismate mutase [Salmonella bongori serovar 40:z35:-]
MIRTIAIFLCSLLMCSTTFADSVTSVSLGALSDALNERMLLMKEVAAYKMKYQLPVNDFAREQNVFAEAEEEAKNNGLDPRSVRPFIRSLMDAGKAIQQRYLAQWRAGLSPPFPTQALSVSRQRIRQIDNQLLIIISQRLMVGAFSHEDMAWLRAQLSAPNLSEADINDVLAALSLVQRTH